MTLFLAKSIDLFAQEKSVCVIDSNTGSPVMFANVCIETPGKNIYKVTDQNGRFSYTADYPLVIVISSIGYKTLRHTLHAGSDSIINLTPALFDLDEVVVTGQMSPRKSDQSIYKVSVINKQQIEQKAATNLTGLLNNELNINLSQDGILGRTLSIRGLDGEHIKILIDGVPVVGRQNGIIDLDQLNLNNVDHVEIVEGPLSVLYGSNALGGTINIITDNKTAGNFTGEINTYYETVGEYNIFGSFRTKFKNHNIGISFARNFFQGFDPDKNTRYKLWKPKLQYIPGINYFYNGEKVKLKLNAEYLNEELHNNDSLSAKYLYEAAEDRYYFTNRFNSSLSALITASDKSWIQLTGGYSFYDKIKNSYINDLVNLRKQLIDNPDVQDTTTFHLVNQRGTYTYSANKIELISGYDLNLENGDGKRIAGHRSIYDYAFFANLMFSPSGAITFQPGVRMAYNTKYKAPLVYSLSVKSDPGNFRFRASYGKGFRTPSLKELYMEFIDQNHHVYGNENLKAEISHNFTVSGCNFTRFGQNQLKVSLDLYYNRIFNKIDFLFDPVDPTRAKYFNISNGIYKSQGAELEIGYNFHPRLALTTGIAVNGVSTLTDLNRFVYNTDYIFSFNYKSLRHRFRLSAFYKYTGRKTFYRGEYDMNEELQSIKEEYVDGYQNLDITLSAPFSKNRILMSAGIKNVFNNITVFSSGTVSVHSGNDNFIPVSWGRTFFLKMNYRFVRY